MFCGGIEITEFAPHLRDILSYLNTNLLPLAPSTEGISVFIYGVKEIPGLTAPYTIRVPNITMPEWFPIPTPSIVPSYSPFLLYPTLAGIEESLSFDDTYNQIPKPDIQSVEKFERISDEIFVVNDFKLWW